ncbi:S-layer homology domain-containing protein [Paenibacillus sp. 453mf]|uniref:S-layer homology domain-containing protein n=1 Tax=Paenibacillus sp. 453mf TaxID=1761874 RepID=UPI0008F21F5C|nr:S-layer homology domain-containing protein [Paenibacillus sp. 453mf]SFS85547.1 S-layer homology domain-containing protein [Paenibacillus sp. 453mf]
MSNTGNQFTSTSNHKENNHVMISRGGEKKVMKKILSVALSTAMAFSMFASVAFGQTGLTDVNAQYNYLKDKGIFSGFPDGQAHLDRQMTRAEFAKVITKTLGLKEVEGVYSFKDKNYGENHWAAPYVEAVYAAGIMEGVNSTKKIFGVSNPVTIQEMATVLVRALDLEVPTETNNSATTWAKGYVQAAINAGLVDANANFQSNATRELLVGAAYSVDQELSLSVESYTVIESGKAVEFKMTDGETVKVTLDTALEANKETEVKFTYQEKEFTEKVTYVVTAATKVEAATATNYKELQVKYDGDVDATTATNVDNYKVSGVNFESATLSADKKTVTLLVKQEDASKLPQQKETNLTISGVKNADGSKTFSETVKFTAVDTQLPEVSEVTGLGTKALRVEFSEPVTAQTANNLANYKVDGQVISGSVKFTYPNVAFITTNLPVGEHSLTVSNIKDYAGFTIATSASDFTIAEDTAAPEITSVTTSDLREVKVTFNEPVKSVKSAYHTSSNKSATVTVKDNVVTLQFSEPNKLSLGANTVYLTGVTDYSDNSADRNATVTPELDTVRPTVVEVTADSDEAGTDIIVSFSEKILPADITVKSNYVLKKSNGDVYTGQGFSTKGNPSVTPKYGTTNGKEDQTKVVLSTVGGPLPAGDYTLEVSGVRDQATIGNAIIPQSVAFSTTVVGSLKVVDAWYSSVDADNYEVYVEFARPVATSGSGSALDVNKYDYVTGATYTPFQSASTSIALYNTNTVVLTVPKDKATGLTGANAIRVVNVADTNGNYVGNGSVDLKSQADSHIGFDADTIKATDRQTITAELKGNLTYVDPSDFVITVGTSTYDSSDFTLSSSNATGVTVLTFTLDEEDVIPYNAENVKLTTLTNINDISSTDSVGRKLQPSFVGEVADGITAVADEKSLNASGRTITLSYSEALDVNYTPAAFTVTVDGTAVKVTNATEGTGSVLTLTLEKAVTANQNVEVELNGNASGSYVTDVAGNKVADFYYTTPAK